MIGTDDRMCDAIYEEAYLRVASTPDQMAFKFRVVDNKLKAYMRWLVKDVALLLSLKR